MKHIFLPYKLSKLAKEKNFNEKCLTCYMSDGNLFMNDEWSLGITKKDLNKDSKECLAPTYYQIIEWFIEEYNIYINVLKNEGESFVYYKISGSRFSSNELTSTSEDYIAILNLAIEEAFKLI